MIRLFSIFCISVIFCGSVHAQNRPVAELEAIEREFGERFYDDLMTFRPAGEGPYDPHSWFNIGRAISVRDQALKEVITYHRAWIERQGLKEGDALKYRELSRIIDGLQSNIEFYFLILPADLRKVNPPSVSFSGSRDVVFETKMYDQYLEFIHESYSESVPSTFYPDHYYQDLMLLTRFRIVRMLAETIQQHDMTSLELAKMIQDFSQGKGGFEMVLVKLNLKLDFKDRNIDVKKLVFGQIHETLNVIIDVFGMPIKRFEVSARKKTWGRRAIASYVKSELDVTREMVRSHIGAVIKMP